MLTIGVLGSTGMLGSMVYKYFKNRGHNVVGFSRSEVEGYNDRPLDVFNNNDLQNLFLWMNGSKVDAVINCIGLLITQSETDPAKAVYLNSYFPHLLERWTKDSKTKVIHISTDCIFNGEFFIPYNEDSIPDETNWYGRTKALGELNNNKDLTLRQSIIGPAPQKNNTGLLNWILNQKEKTINGFDLVQWNGITTLELAKHIEIILTNCPQLSGIYNLVPDEEIIDKYHLLCMIKKIWNLDVTIKKDHSLSSFKILENTRTDYPANILNYKQQLTELYNYIKVDSLK